MVAFETRIVRTWEPSKWLRILGALLLVGSGITLYVWKPDIRWLMILSGIVYLISFIFALSFSFIKPKNLGIISITEDRIQVNLKEEKREFQISELLELGLDYKGYASFWKHSIYGNKNHLYFTNSSNDKFDYEIVIENKEKKEELKQFLEDLSVTHQLKVAHSGLSSF